MDERPPTVLVATELGIATGGLALAASVGVAAARLDQGADPLPVLLVELGAEGGRGPTMLASRAARTLERALRAAGFDRASARGALCWLGLPDGADGIGRLVEALSCLGEVEPAVAVVHGSPADARTVLESPELSPRAAILRCELPRDRALAALTVGELRRRRQRVRIERRPVGVIGARRALAGIEPGGGASRRAARIATVLLRRATALNGRRLGAEAGQALPLVLGLAVVLILAATALIALGGGVAGAERGQDAVDLAAISAVRSMRDDLPRLAAPAALPNGAPNPYHLGRGSYLARAAAAAREAAGHNGLDVARLRVSFPDATSPAPLRARVEIDAEADVGGAANSRAPGPVDVSLSAEAEAAPPALLSAGASGAPATASGGGYSGPLAFRQGKPMRPDVAAAFDRMSAAATAAGLSLVVNSAYRSDAEQARLYAADPDPRWVAPPGTSLHRCATELDLGPPDAYGWLAANAGRFGFLQRYSWEPWHYGFTGGPAPCSAAGNGGGEADGSVAGEGGLPGFVPREYRAALQAAAVRWGVPAGLLAAQLEAESGFDARATSPAGALGIAQFMPATAAAYGLRDPFDPLAAIDAEGHLMADLLLRFGSTELALAAYNAGPGAVEACRCVPDIPETQAYVARILGLMDAAGAIALPEPLEVRLTS